MLTKSQEKINSIKFMNTLHLQIGCGVCRHVNIVDGPLPVFLVIVMKAPLFTWNIGTKYALLHGYKKRGCFRPCMCSVQVYHLHQKWI